MTKREKIQEMALRFVHGDYTSDYDGLLSIFKLPSLKLDRERNIATLTYNTLFYILLFYFILLIQLCTALHSLI